MSDSERQDALSPVLRTQQIIVGSLVAGCVFFLVVALFVSRGMAAGGGAPMISYIAIAFAVTMVLARVVAPRAVVAAGRQKILHEKDPKAARGGPPKPPAAVDRLLQLHSTATIVSCSLLEGAVFFLLVAYLMENWLPTLLVAVALIVLLALHMPTRSRVIHWIEDQLALLLQEQQLSEKSGRPGERTA